MEIPNQIPVFLNGVVLANRMLEYDPLINPLEKIMSSYAELLKQREELEKQIESARQNEIKEAVATVRELVGRFELSVADVFPGEKSKGAKPVSKVAAKYKDPMTGATWTGRGKAPKWIDGKDRQAFAI